MNPMNNANPMFPWLPPEQGMALMQGQGGAGAYANPFAMQQMPPVTGGVPGMPPPDQYAPSMKGPGPMSPGGM